jgi:hypothetical protein
MAALDDLAVVVGAVVVLEDPPGLFWLSGALVLGAAVSFDGAVVFGPGLQGPVETTTRPGASHAAFLSSHALL